MNSIRRDEGEGRRPKPVLNRAILFQAICRIQDRSYLDDLRHEPVRVFGPCPLVDIGWRRLLIVDARCEDAWSTEYWRNDQAGAIRLFERTRWAFGVDSFDATLVGDVLEKFSLLGWKYSVPPNNPEVKELTRQLLHLAEHYNSVLRV